MTPERTISLNRIVSLFGVFALLVGGIGFRLVSFQVTGSEKLQTQGRNIRVNERTILPRRGLIFDRGGLVLATNVPSTDIYAQPRKLTERQRELVARELSLVLNRPYNRILESVSAPNVDWSRVARHVDDGTVEIIKRRLAEAKLPSLAYQEEPNRIYPNGVFLSPLLGYTNADGMGVYGLEGRYNALVGGEPGILVAETDNAQQPLAFGQQQYRAPVEGADLVLTIDAAIQRMAEEELARTVAEQGAKGGTILVMDPNTGAVLACASNPTYDPNSYGDVTDPATFVNPATGEVYEPGSTLKVLTMAAGLQTGAITTNSTLNDEGYFQVETDRVMNFNNASYGPETMAQVLERSSNVGASWIATRTGKEKFYAMMRAFGMGQRTGIDLDGEEIGLVKWPDDPTRFWFPIDLVTNSFGQGVGVTPMQMVTAVSAIANGGTLYTPYTVSRVERRGEVVMSRAPQAVRQVLRPEVAKSVTGMMTQATRSALAPKINLPGYDIAAKTGTAQIPDARGRYDPDKTITSIVSFFPSEKPVYTVLIKIDQPKKNALGADVAAPALGRLAGQLLRYAGIPPKGT